MKPYFLTYVDCEKWLEYEKNIKTKKKKGECSSEVSNYILEIREEEEKYILNNNCINKPHDKLFRELLDNKQEAIIFIKKFIDKENELEADDIEKYNRTFITKEYNELQSDIIYKIKDKNVFFLIEHQSTRDYNMAYRFLKYALAITESVTEKGKIGKKGYKYPKVVPILIYTGEGKWNISDCLEQEECKNLDKYGLQLKYNIVDVSEYTEEELLEMDSIVAYAMAIEKCKNDEELPKLLKKIASCNK